MERSKSFGFGTWLRSRQPYEFMRPSFAPMPLRAEYSCAVGAPVRCVTIFPPPMRSRKAQSNHCGRYFGRLRSQSDSKNDEGYGGCNMSAKFHVFPLHVFPYLSCL